MKLPRHVMRRILLSAVSPAAFLVGMPPIPRSQRAWIVKLCADMSNAMTTLEGTGKANG